jgi:uncharacterized protein
MSYLAVAAIAAVVLYAVIGAALFVWQRRLQYRPEATRMLPAACGLPEATEHIISTADGQNIIIWQIPPRPGFPVVVFLPGSAGALRMHVDRFRQITADGTGLLALSYRGYGGSSGSPAEQGLIEDARSLWRHATMSYAPETLVVWGLSLGAAVGIALAAERPVRRLIVEGGFSSAAAIAQRRYPMFPVRWCIRDKFDCAPLIARVSASILFVHGERDELVPIAEAKWLFDRAVSRKHLVTFAAGGHDDLLDHGLARSVRGFVLEAQLPIENAGFFAKKTG